MGDFRFQLSLAKHVLALATILGFVAFEHVAAASSAHLQPIQDEEAVKIDSALQAWNAGNWRKTRGILEPMVSEGQTLADPVLTERALRYLADATLLDTSLEPEQRRQAATQYIQRLLNENLDWNPPSGLHSPEFYELTEQIRAQKQQDDYTSCRAERASCIANVEELEIRLEDLKNEHQTLKTAFNEQEVEVLEKVARNRAVALVPFGVGQFYNGNKYLGASFAAVEAATGITALGLLIARTQICNRRSPFDFSSGALTCRGEQSKYLAIRNAEQGMAIAFLSAVVLDIVIAQITFKPYRLEKRQQIKRKDLESLPLDPPSKLEKRKQQRSRKHQRLDVLRQARPVPTYVPGGGGVGVHLRF